MRIILVTMSAAHLRGEAAAVPEGAAAYAGVGVSSNAAVLEKLRALYLEAFAHDGFAGIQVEMRILRRGQKEVILHCGKQYRFVVDYAPEAGGGRNKENKDKARRTNGARTPAEAAA